MHVAKARAALAFVRTALCAGAFIGSGALVGCAPPETTSSSTGGGGGSSPVGTGGASATGGAAASGGAPGSGGGVSATGGAATGTGGAGSGGSASGGAPGTGGLVGTGGGVGGVGGGGRGGAGGTAGRGVGGSASGGAGGAGGKEPPDPSAGCGKANPPVGSSGSPLTVSSHQYYVKLPTSYDASKAYPALFVFNPTNNPLNWAEQNAGFESNDAKAGAIRVYPGPANMAAGWGAGDVSFFRPLYNQIVANYCVDRARVFATGESSGGDFSSILGCEHAEVLRAVAPCATKVVSAYPLTVSRRTCTGQVAAVVIHGKNDNVVGPENGPATRDFYVALNHCGTTTQPVQGYTDPMSNCVQYQGCDAGYPVYWCQHTDPNYGGTNHGWPRFAPNMLWSLFSSY
jgi:polyhydroxybutyrate depolymerase